MSDKQKKNWEELEIGALWGKESKDKSRKFMSGYINFFGQKVPIVVFPNRKKTDKDYKPDLDKKNWPDAHIYRDEKEEVDAQS